MLEKSSILIVEDDLDTKNIMEDILENIFHTVYSANNGMDALELYKQNQPDIVLTDIIMPSMDGVELTKAIRQLNPSQKIAISTAYNDEKYINELKAEGVIHILTKPIDANYLEQALNKLADYSSNSIP
jgi:CheY-like chemotaxis protein